MPCLTNRVPWSVAQYADRLLAGDEETGAMTPDRVADLLAELAAESLDLARRAQQAATAELGEAGRFVTDWLSLASTQIRAAVRLV